MNSFNLIYFSPCSISQRNLFVFRFSPLLGGTRYFVATLTSLAIGQVFSIKIMTAIQKQMKLAIFSYLTCAEIKTQIFTINGLEETTKNCRGHAPMMRWDSRELRSHSWIKIIRYRGKLDKVVDSAIHYSRLKGYEEGIRRRNTAVPPLTIKQINRNFATFAKVPSLSWARRNRNSLQNDITGHKRVGIQNLKKSLWKSS